MADATQAAPAGRIAFFRPGRHTAVDGREIEFTPTQLADAAASYSADAHEAPLVVGHPQLNAPAYGWVSGLSFDGGLISADTHQVQPAFAELVNSGAFKKVSASWYLPDSPGNPKPGHLYLRHIGFLGAAPPALKGLPDAAFADGDGAVTVEFAAAPAKTRGLFAGVADFLRRLRNFSDADLAALDSADVALPAFAAPAAAGITTETDMTDQNKAAEFAEREAQLKRQADENAAAATALKTREETIAKAEREAHKKTVAEFVEGLAKKGQILPRHKAPIVEVLCAFAPDATVSFAEGDKTVSKAPGDLLREFLSSLPAQINFAEKSADDASRTPASFAAPENTQVDAARLEIHGKALAWQAQHPNTSYLDAVRAVGGR